MRVSIVVPVYQGAPTLPECLRALRAAAAPEDELIVVDDASTDGGATIAAAAGATVVRLSSNHGPARARNVGAAAAHGDVLLFVDADVALAPDAVARVRRALALHPEIAAVFGSYDDRPRAPGLVSQYRNLLHHFVHQHGAADAFSFWAGCGAVRREPFERVGGFDGCWRAIEDIELGYRLRAAGFRILLDHDLQGSHLKRWTLRSMLWTDLTQRAAPWARLALEHRAAPRDLNLGTAQRVSLVLVFAALGALAVAPWRPVLAVAALGALVAVVVLNREFYRFLARVRGPAFALASVPLHFLYFICGGLGVAYAGTAFALARLRRSAP